jgi:peroxiredoxin
MTRRVLRVIGEGRFSLRWTSDHWASAHDSASQANPLDIDHVNSIELGTTPVLGGYCREVIDAPRRAARHTLQRRRVPRMSVKVGDQLPDGELKETTEFDSATQCAMAPKDVKVADAVRGKKIAIFGVPGAYTPTCSAKHVPGYLQHFDALKKGGVDEVWCVATNDAFVMAHWGREQKALGKIRFLGDATAEWSKALGLEQGGPGMGTRTKRFSMLVENGRIVQLNVEEPGKFEVSDAETLLKQLA